MFRLLLIAVVWMTLSFLLLAWVQFGLARFHRDAVETIGKAAISADEPKVTGDKGDAALVTQALRQQRISSGDLEQLEFDRKEVMRRLKIMWTALTLAPLLVALAVKARKRSANPPVEAPKN